MDRDLQNFMDFLFMKSQLNFKVSPTSYFSIYTLGIKKFTIILRVPMLSFVTPFILTPGESKRSEYNPRKQQLRVNLLLVSLRAADSTKLCQRSDDINVTNVARDMRI